MSEKPRIIDFHAHILPCADHGSGGIQTSLEQLALINNAGVDTVVATPHFYPHIHTVKQFTDTVSSAAEELCVSAGKRPALCLGAEVLYYDGIEEMEGLRELCIRGTDILMLELPLADWDKNIVYSVKRLTEDHTVLLAHIDRYVETCPEIIDALISVGALAQINTSSLFYGSIRKRLSSYISDGLVYAIGSDLHEVNKKTYAQFSKAEKKLGEEYLRIMERSEKLLNHAKMI